MSARLDTFFAVMGGFLDGETSAEDVERALGPSPSGTARLALYAKLVGRQRRDVLDSLFPAVRHACASVRQGLWDELTRAFVRAHPPRHWEPNRLGEPMAEFLARQHQGDSSIPGYLEELADYAYIRFAVATATPAADGVGLDRTLFVRRYEHDVVAFTRAVKGTTSAEWPSSPAASACTLIVAWSTTALGVIELHPSLATLAAIGRRLGDDRAALRADAPSENEVDRADHDLVVRGVLGPRAH